MSWLQDTSCKNSFHTHEERALLLNTVEVLDEEKENILTEVLRCYVCFELPKGKQVRICEEGHHFCHTCHEKIKVCGICRGGLLESRNFVVEQLVSKLAPILGISYELPPARPAINCSPGFYQCLHQCQVRVPAFQMLPHLRINHPANLLENVRSNSYFGCFSLKLSLHFVQNEKYVWSTYISDMGLFATELSFFGFDFFGCVRMLADETVASQFRYQLVLKVPNGDSGCLVEFSLTNCPVSSYLDDIKGIHRRKNCLKVMGTQLLEYIDVGSEITVFFSLWEKKERSFMSRERSGPSLVCVPERDLHFENSRKTRRNRNRNMRRSRLKKLRELARSEIVEGLSNLAL